MILIAWLLACGEPACPDPGVLDADPAVADVKPPLDADGAICKTDSSSITTHHHGQSLGMVMDRYRMHYSNHGWTVTMGEGGLSATRKTRTIDVRFSEPEARYTRTVLTAKGAP